MDTKARPRARLNVKQTPPWFPGTGAFTDPILPRTIVSTDIDCHPNIPQLPIPLCVSLPAKLDGTVKAEHANDTTFTGGGGGQFQGSSHHFKTQEPLNLSQWIDEANILSVDGKDEVSPSPTMPLRATASSTKPPADEQPHLPVTTVAPVTASPNLISFFIDTRKWEEVSIEEWAMGVAEYTFESSVMEMDSFEHLSPANDTWYRPPRRRRSEPDHTLNVEPMQAVRRNSASLPPPSVNSGGARARREKPGSDENSDSTIQARQTDRSDDISDSTIRSERTDRSQRDRLLLFLRGQGYRYKQIRELGGFDEAESTLRGRYRALTKPSDARVRKPQWQRNDVLLLRRAVARFSRGIDKDTRYRNGRGRLPWKRIAEWMTDHGASYDFAPATCAKKWSDKGNC